MTIREAIISVPHAEYTKLGIEEFVSLCREARLTNIRETACRESGCTLEITVKSPLAEEELDALEYIKWWERLERSSDEVKYLCKLVVPAADASIEAAPLVLPSYHEMEASSDELQVDDESLLISLVGSQEALLEGISMYEDAGMNVLLKKSPTTKGQGTFSIR